MWLSTGLQRHDFESCPSKALGAFCVVVIVLIAVVHPLRGGHSLFLFLFCWSLRKAS
jgi:hypothetical protein